MLPFVLGAVGLAAAAKLAHKVFIESRYDPPKSTLEYNLERLAARLSSVSEKKTAILGQPGAGKSSMLKKMTGGGVVPLPVIGNQTDATDWSSDRMCDLVSTHGRYMFADVPGYDTASHPVQVVGSRFPWRAFDVYVLVVNGKVHDADKRICEIIKRSGKPFCIARSFCESLDEESRWDVIVDLSKQFNVGNEVPILFFSNREGTGLDAIYDFIKKA